MVNPCAVSTQSVRPRRRAATVAAAQPRRVIIPKWQQEVELVRAVSGRGQRLLLIVLMHTGARFGESAYIHPDSLNPQDNTIYISQQLMVALQEWKHTQRATGRASQRQHLPRRRLQRRPGEATLGTR